MILRHRPFVLPMTAELDRFSSKKQNTPKRKELVEEIHQFQRKGMTVILLLFKIFSYQSNAWTTFLHTVVYQTT